MYTLRDLTLMSLRFAYSGIDKDMIVEGIRNLADYIRSKQA
jgi:DNA-binding transcriptional MocR family regulator